jgi:hypothetical protein
VDPLQLFGGIDLLSAERPCDCAIGIGDLFRHPVIVGKVYDFELRKIVPQARGKPLWRLPKSKAVMECDEKFHSTSFEFQVSSFK